MATTSVTVEPGIFKRLNRHGHILPKLWIHYPSAHGGTEREPANTTSLVRARRLRAQRLEEQGRGEPGRSGEKVKVSELLEGVAVNYAINRRRSVKTLKSHLRALQPAFGHLRAIDCTTDVVERWQLRWQQEGDTNATINRRCNVLRRAFNLGRRARKVHIVPYIPRLEERSPRGLRLSNGDALAIVAELPLRQQQLFVLFACDYGIRKGQLARTQRKFVDKEQRLVDWPPEETKPDDIHTLPLDPEGWSRVEELLADARPWCPFVFHGRHCAPGHKPSQDYGCIGNIRKAWETACKKAGLPIGRKSGGYVFHHTRNTASTDLRAHGMEEADAMKVTGHKTAHVFRHYNLGDVEALRAKLTDALTRKRAVPPTRKVAPMRRAGNA